MNCFTWMWWVVELAKHCQSYINLLWFFCHFRCRPYVLPWSGVGGGGHPRYIAMIMFGVVLNLPSNTSQNKMCIMYTVNGTDSFAWSFEWNWFFRSVPIIALSPSQGVLSCLPSSHLLPQMIPFIFLYGGGCSVVDDGDRDIRRRRSAHAVIIRIISLVIFVHLGGQSEESD